MGGRAQLYTAFFPGSAHGRHNTALFAVQNQGVRSNSASFTPFPRVGGEESVQILATEVHPMEGSDSS